MRLRCCWSLPGQAAGAVAAPLRPGRAHVTPALAAATRLGSVRHISAGACLLRAATPRSTRRSRSLPRRPLDVKALVAVDYSQPAIWLGLGLIGGGLSLYQLRRVQPVLSRDFDIVVSSVVIFSGGILIFQGWRLDPLLLFCQLLTAGTALAWALEAIKLRRLVDNEQRFDERARQYPPLEPPGQAARDGGGLGRGIPLPPPREEFGRWYAPEAEQALYGEEGLPTASGQQQQYYGGGRGREDAYGPPYGGPYEEVGPYDSAEAPYGREGGRYGPEYGEQAGAGPGREGPGWGVVDDVESYYNRPLGSVTEDVERFYGSGGGGAEEPESSRQQDAGPREQPRGDDWQYYGQGGRPAPEYPWPPPPGPADGWQADDGYGRAPGQDADGDRREPGARPRGR